MEDMLMIENQVPLMVLATLVATEREVTINDEVIHYINDLVFHFVRRTNFFLQVDQSIELAFYRGLHLLELTWQLVSGEQYERIFERDFNLKPIQFLSASYLYEKAQVELRRSETNSLNGIRFENGVLSLPIFRIQSPTELVLLNLVAFEHLHAGASHEVSSFIDFMSGLINSAKDLSLIRSINVMETIWNDEAVPIFIQKIRNDMGFSP
ncbi:UPF0481 protein At3g47200-like [Tasmannia lanceolata]|uniref:UPF0481 protein At3g47200-like n=1 Tax=Tasmannia lanceolata TaxID=3420 RepID=UPI0040634830